MLEHPSITMMNRRGFLEQHEVELEVEEDYEFDVYDDKVFPEDEYEIIDGELVHEDNVERFKKQLEAEKNRGA